MHNKGRNRQDGSQSQHGHFPVTLSSPYFSSFSKNTPPAVTECYEEALHRFHYITRGRPVVAATATDWCQTVRGPTPHGGRTTFYTRKYMGTLTHSCYITQVPEYSEVEAENRLLSSQGMADRDVTATTSFLYLSRGCGASRLKPKATHSRRCWLEVGPRTPPHHPLDATAPIFRTHMAPSTTDGQAGTLVSHKRDLIAPVGVLS